MKAEDLLEVNHEPRQLIPKELFAVIGQSARSRQSCTHKGSRNNTLLNSISMSAKLPNIAVPVDQHISCNSSDDTLSIQEFAQYD